MATAWGDSWGGSGGAWGMSWDISTLVVYAGPFFPEASQAYVASSVAQAYTASSVPQAYTANTEAFQLEPQR